MTTKYKWTIRLSMLTPVLIVICAILMGGGHGWYTPTITLFPLATLNIVWQDHLSEPFLIAGIFQYIIYGLIIDKIKGTKHLDRGVIFIIFSHIALAIFILTLRNPEWR